MELRHDGQSNQTVKVAPPAPPRARALAPAASAVEAPGVSNLAYLLPIGGPSDSAGNSVTTVIFDLSTPATMLPYLSLQQRGLLRGSLSGGRGTTLKSSGLEDAGGNAAVAQGMGCMRAGFEWTIPPG